MIRLWLKAIRVDQWTKNGAVMMAWFFSVADASQKTLERGLSSFLLAFFMGGAVSFVSSAFYLLNDISDYEDDRRHPVKRLRPIAAGVISRVSAIRVALVLFAIGFAYPAAVVMLRPDRTIAFGTVLAYTVMQCLYTGLLKRVPYVDVATLSAGFVLRAIAGAAIIDAYISPWLLVCTFSLSLFLALCKRKSELDVSRTTRAVLRHYHPGLLIFFIILTGVGCVGEYLAYSFTSAMGRRFPLLWMTAIFVALGILRYAYLTWSASVDTERPEKVLLSDKWIWLVLFGYTITAVWVVLR